MLVGALLVPMTGDVSARVMAPRAGTRVVVRAVTTLTLPYGKFRPRSVSVGRNTIVIWKAGPGRAHFVNAYSPNWTLRQRIDDNPGTPVPQKVAFKFRHNGTYKFRCRVHSTLVGGNCSGMCGTVVVG